MDPNFGNPVKNRKNNFARIVNGQLIQLSNGDFKFFRGMPTEATNPVILEFRNLGQGVRTYCMLPYFMFF